MWMWMCPSYRCRWPQRVLINSDGDMIVRPSFIEAAVQRRSTSSVAHHLLVNYQRAHIAVIKAQFTSKRFRDGMAVSTHQLHDQHRRTCWSPPASGSSRLWSSFSACKMWDLQQHPPVSPATACGGRGPLGHYCCAGSGAGMRQVSQHLRVSDVSES